MDTVLKILDTIAAVLSVFPRTWGLTVEILGPFGILLFLGGFFGLLITFLWFFFRYLDKKRLAFPAFVFTVFFLLFLGGNLLMLAQEGRTENNSRVSGTETAAIEEAAV